jgi:hypothetical protein
MGKRVWLLVGLAVALLLWPIAQADEGDSEGFEVVWTVEGCVMELQAPSSIDLGTATAGETLSSDPSEGELRINSNCAYTVALQLDGFDKDGNPASGDLLTLLLNQYEFQTASVSPNSKIDNLQPSYTTFGSVGESRGVCRSKDGATLPFVSHKCRLQFRVDTSLLPAGSYVANHTVTLSTP